MIVQQTLVTLLYYQLVLQDPERPPTADTNDLFKFLQATRPKVVRDPGLTISSHTYPHLKYKCSFKHGL